MAQMAGSESPSRARPGSSAFVSPSKPSPKLRLARPLLQIRAACTKIKMSVRASVARLGSFLTPGPEWPLP